MAKELTIREHASDSRPANSSSTIRSIIDYSLAFHLDTIRELLKSHELPVSGNKSALRKRLIKALNDATIDIGDLTEPLETVEG